MKLPLAVLCLLSGPGAAGAATAQTQTLSVQMDTCSLIPCEKKQQDAKYDKTRKRCVIIYGVEGKQPVKEEYYDFNLTTCQRGPVVKTVDRRADGPRVPADDEGPKKMPHMKGKAKTPKQLVLEQLQGVNDAIEVSEYKLKVCPNKDATLALDCSEYEVKDDKAKCERDQYGITALCVKKPFDPEAENENLEKLRKKQEELEMKRARF